MTDHKPFSERQGYKTVQEAPITVREDAPEDFRWVVVEVAYRHGFKPSRLRELVCQVLKKRPDSNNWSEFPNIDREVRDLVDDCPWFYVYDILERIVAALHTHRTEQAWHDFQEEINSFFLEQGIGWKLVDGLIVYRGPEGFDTVVAQAYQSLEASGHMTASKELHEAIKDLSRRPVPDTTGAVQHAMASLECVARDITGDKSTLGEWVKHNRAAFPAPLDVAVEKLWGYTSEHGRHLQQGAEPPAEEAELIVGISAAIGSYLAKKGTP
ncbi:AbiJ-NTD4 domain-containing protein [Ralstonia sp. 3PA37C10]|uniref:AbiJ-NTD4 domain-containing protein n=1 Tax=Ralstonia TaxID=48736 RepID=UPI002017F802|nr:hypothetical protein [Ralstonia sp. 3PA37C10]